MPGGLEVRDEGHVRVLTLDRAHRKNAFDQSLYQGLAHGLAESATTPSIHCAVVTGAGGCFSAGQDLDEMAAIATGELSGADGFEMLLTQLETFPKPLLAAVDGAAVGIGMTMLLHCDIVLVADTARLRVPFSELGVPPEAGSSALLPDAVGWQQAAELLFSSRWITGTEAVQVGLALRLVSQERLMATTMELAQQIAAQSPFAVSKAKELMLAARGDRSRQARRRENDAFLQLFRGSDRS